MGQFQYNDYQTDLEDIARRQKYAELLKEQSMQPLQTQMAGRVAIPISWTQGLAKMLQGYSGAMGDKRATEERKALAQKYQDDLQTTLNSARDLQNGMPARAAVPMPSDEAGGGPSRDAIAATKPDPLAAAMMLLRHPETKGIGGQMYQTYMKQNTASDLFGKVIPKDYTPESIRRFAETRNFADLVPRNKLEFQNTGSAVAGLDPYTGATVSTIQKTQSPDAAATLAQRQFEWANLSPDQRARLQNEAARIGISAAELFFNTGMQAPSMGAATGAIPTPGAPMAPPMGSPSVPPMTNPMGQPAPTPQNFPRVTPQVQQGRDAERLALLRRELADQQAKGLVDPALQQEIANAERAAGIQPSPAPAPQTPALPPRAQAEVDAAAARDRILRAQESARSLPQTLATAEQSLALLDQMIGSKDGKTKKHPGFSSVIGGTLLPGLRFIPGTDAASFDVLLDQVKGGAFLQAFESLKGGGQITEIEGRKATDAITRMNRSQSESEFIKAAREYQDVIRAGIDRAKRASGVSSGGASGGWRDF